MPSKKGSKKGKIDKEFSRKALHFRNLLSAARTDYAKGRSFDAADLQKQALEYGAKHLPRFEDNSLIKAHALLELGLATSAICTDFVTGEEWKQKSQEMKITLNEALQIYHNRLSNGTLTKWRKEEVWMKGKNSYESPVPHTERLGPVDFVSCTNMACGFHATPEAVVALKKALQFARQFRASKCVIQTESGLVLQGQMPDDGSLDRIRTSLRRHEKELAGVAVDQKDDFTDTREEMRHTGTRLGKMKLSHEKLARDVEKKGLRKCGHGECDKMERQPREFATCARCKWTCYCCKEHQVADWPAHKKLCKSVAVEQRQEYKESIKAKNNLLHGQAQTFITIVVHMHHSFVQSPEVKPLLTRMNPGMVAKLKSVEDHRKLSMPEISFLWSCFWSVPKEIRLPVLERFVDEIKSFRYNSAQMGGPDFAVVLEWNEHAVVGLFAVVKHTSKGSIFLHDDGSKVHAYQVVGITNSVESMIGTQALPLYIQTSLLPFKGLIVTQGTIMAGFDATSRLQDAADAYQAEKTEELKVVTNLNPGKK